MARIHPELTITVHPELMRDDWRYNDPTIPGKYPDNVGLRWDSYIR